MSSRDSAGKSAGTEGAEPLLSEAEALLRSDPASARELATAIAVDAELAADRPLAAYALCLSGAASLHLGDIAVGLGDLERSRRLASGGGASPALRIRIANGIGSALHQLGRYAEADRAFERALQSARRLGQPSGVLRCLVNYGFAKSEAGRHEDALAHFTEALDLSLEASGGDYERAEALPVLLGNIGLALLRLGRVEDARSYLGRAVEASAARGDQVGLANCLCSLGESHLGENPDEAEELLAESLSTCLRIGANLTGVRSALVLARHSLDSGQLDEAEAVIAEWLPRAERGDSLRHAELVRLKGRLLSLRGRFSEAYEASELAGALERKVGFASAATASLAIDRGKYARRSKRLVERVESWNEAVNLTLAALIEAKDAPTGRHVERAAEIARRLGERLIASAAIPGLSEALLDAIVGSTPLHDIGKIAVPDSIIGKPGPLDSGERERMQRHVVVGKEILLDAAMRVSFEPRIKVAAEIAGYHHERWDGTGYPEGRSGDAIPISARIVAVADVYDAIRSERPYKPAHGREAAASYVRDNASLHFDPRVVAAFLDIEDEIAELYAS